MEESAGNSSGDGGTSRASSSAPSAATIAPLSVHSPGRFDDAGAKRVPMDVKVGDIVLYSKYGGTEVKYSGEEYLVLSARDVLAVIEK